MIGSVTMDNEDSNNSIPRIINTVPIGEVNESFNCVHLYCIIIILSICGGAWLAAICSL